MFPVIDCSPTHVVKLPVMGKNVSFKPFKVEQEKMFLTAMRSSGSGIGDITRNFLEIMKTSAVDTDLTGISVVDFLTLLTSIRAKSKGETLSLKKPQCTNEKCGLPFEFDIHVINSFNYENEGVLKDVVRVTDKLSVEIVPVSIDFYLGMPDQKYEDEISAKIDKVSCSINKVVFGESIFTRKDFTVDMVKANFVNKMTEDQLDLVYESTRKMIDSYIEAVIECPYCERKNNVKIYDYLKLYV